MNTLKQILNYLIWVLLSLLLGVSYMRIILGPKKEESTGFWHLLNIFYDVALRHIGLRIGGAIALLFILVDIFYLKKKLKNNIKSIGIRFIVLLGITAMVAIILYIF
jgi:hypothetical protein